MLNSSYKNEIRDTLKDYEKAKSKHANWVELWRECYNFTNPNISKKNKFPIYDATAPDAVDELAGVLINELYPYTSDWVEIKDINTKELQHNDISNQVRKNIMEAIRTSNFQVEIHQIIMDLIVAGTGVMLIEQGDLNSDNKIKFNALDIQNIILSEKSHGQVDALYINKTFSFDELITKYPNAKAFISCEKENSYNVIETIKQTNGKWQLVAILLNDKKNQIIMKTEYENSPFVVFRWQKQSGEVYGRSPVMKSLPDIKTVNKIAELTLKNASISVTGIWQADDDGVLNPNNIRLVPGAIIPKAVGSSGLQPLKSPGEFNLSNMLIEPLQQRIRKSLLAGVFTTSTLRTATEVAEQAMRARQILNSVFERITQEAMIPMIKRITNILVKQGTIINPKQHNLYIDAISPNERFNKQQKVMVVKQVIKELKQLGIDISNVFDIKETLLWLSRQMELPDSILINNNGFMLENLNDINNFVNNPQQELLNEQL
ncbi:MAG: portal protein [Alphaproteobacteria bacterium]